MDQDSDIEDEVVPEWVSKIQKSVVRVLEFHNVADKIP